MLLWKQKNFAANIFRFEEQEEAEMKLAQEQEHSKELLQTAQEEAKQFRFIRRCGMPVGVAFLRPPV